MSENTQEPTTEVAPDQEITGLNRDQLKEGYQSLLAQINGLKAKNGSGGIEDAKQIKALNERLTAHADAFRVVVEAEEIEPPSIDEIEGKFRKNVGTSAPDPAPTTDPAPVDPAPTTDPAPAADPVTTTEPAVDPAPAATPTSEPAADPTPVADPAPTTGQVDAIVNGQEPVLANLQNALPTGTGAALQPFAMESNDGTVLRTIGDIGAALSEAAGPKGRSYVGKFYPLGRPETFTAGLLGPRPDDNFRTMFGEDTRTVRTNFRKVSGSEPTDREMSTFTAALNCAGPAQPVLDIPFDYTGGRPLQDSGMISIFPTVVNGQIQVYDCHTLPDFPGLLQEGANCEPAEVDANGDPVPGTGGCDSCGDYDCASYECIQPGPIHTPKPIVTCMCVPEDLTFGNPLILERALEDFSIANDRAYELRWLQQLRDLALKRTVDGSVSAAHGGWSTFLRSVLQLKSRFALDTRAAGGLQDYEMFVPGGEAMFCSTMADKLSRVLDNSAPGEDVLQVIQSRFGISPTFGLDQDPNGAQVAEGFTAPWLSTDPADAPSPLEEMVNAGTVYFVPRDTLFTASPLSIEIGMETRDKCEVGSGCLKMIRREWWFDLIPIGCRKVIAVDFTNMDYCGSGPDLKPCS